MQIFIYKNTDDSDTPTSNSYFNLSKDQFDIVGSESHYVPISEREIDCDGSQYVESIDEVIPSSVGCYEFHLYPN